MIFKTYRRAVALTLCLFMMSSFIATAQNPFVTLWKTDHEGYNASPDDQIVVPLFGEYTYLWEDTSNPSINGSGSGSDTLWLTFPFVGVYRLSITPTGENPFNQIMFSGNDDVVKIIDIEQWGDISWLTMEHAFWGAMNMTISATDIPDLSNVYSMSNAFRETGIDVVPNINQWDVSGVYVMDGMFQEAEYFNSPIGEWDVSNVSDMYKLFKGAVSFNQPIGSWDVGNVVYFSSMFEGAESFNQPIGDWNTGSAMYIDYMFALASNFNQPIGNWDVSNVQNMNGIFYMARSFNQALNDWNTSNAMIMAFMFVGASDFNHPIDRWDVSDVIDMYAMFSMAGSFNQPIGNWDVGNVEDMSGMFNNAFAFNQPVGQWNVSNVKYMYDIFLNATSFDQDLGNWTLSNLQKFQYSNNSLSVHNSGMSCENYSYTLYGWANNPNSPVNAILNSGGCEYSPDVVADRNKLLNEKNWTINGDAEGDCQVSVAVKPDLNAGISISPNPAQDFIVVSGLNGQETLHLTDLSGKTIDVYKAGSNVREINISRLPAGIYHLMIISDNGFVANKKVVKQ